MRHLIEFRMNTNLKLLKVEDGNTVCCSEEVLAGQRARVLIKPYVKNLKEMTDMLFEDNTEARGVPYANFVFVDEDKSID